MEQDCGPARRKGHLWFWPTTHSPQSKLSVNSSTFLCHLTSMTHTIVWASLVCARVCSLCCTLEHFKRAVTTSPFCFWCESTCFGLFNHSSMSWNCQNHLHYSTLFQAIVTDFWKFPGPSQSGLKTNQSTKEHITLLMTQNPLNLYEESGLFYIDEALCWWTVEGHVSFHSDRSIRWWKKHSACSQTQRSTSI